MPKKYKRRGGGIFDSLGETFSNWGNTLSQGAQGIYNKAKQGISGQTTASTYVPTYSSTTPTQSYSTEQSNYQPNYQSNTNTSTYGNYGGTKKRNRKNKRGGGFRDNVSLTNLASHAAPFSGKTAQPHNWVGGKTNRRRKTSSKTKKRHHKSKRH